ncbi:NAD(P)-binding protein [Calocera viscosa TUFC12733]|uniref:NAD(P)-binding protein n=1 Tax=Calocera viscosa (strain TUFC12733) TaxID=1330018 RepID=A0A167GXV1_CALVF|nr:NAD(P)-binding protein [Calocera viscosa TUFC12733]
MAPVPNPCYRFISRPEGFPDLSKDFQYEDSRTIDPDTVDLNGGFLTKTKFLSVDPYMRGRMDPGTFMEWTPGQIWDGFGISEVVRSEMPEYQPGDILYGYHSFEHYNLVHCVEESRARMFRRLENSEGLPLSVYLGVAGLPGKTGFYGLKAIGEPKEGESIFVTTAAGVVGQTVCQLAKAWGLKVLGSTGSDEKVKFLTDEIGIDHAFNYKTASTAQEVRKFGGLDIYWDNVGGEVLDLALLSMKQKGRIVVCGHIAQYNDQEKYGIKNTWEMVYKDVRMQGFYVFTYEEQYADEFYATVPKLVAEGKIKYTEDVTVGLENAGEVLLKVLQGQNVGKAILQM